MPALARAPHEDSLWLLTIAPLIWAGHLVLCYITAAVWCAKFAPTHGPLNGVSSAVIAYTVAALAGIAIVGWEGLRRHRFGGAEATTHDLDTREDGHRFLGFATLLLSGLSAVAVLYAAIASTYFDTCR